MPTGGMTTGGATTMTAGATTTSEPSRGRRPRSMRLREDLVVPVACDYVKDL